MQAARQILADETGAHVGRAPGRERHDETNRPVRPLLRLGAHRNAGDQRQHCHDGAQPHHWKMILLFVGLVILSALLLAG